MELGLELGLGLGVEGWLSWGCIEQGLRAGAWDGAGAAWSWGLVVHGAGAAWS